MDQLIQIQEALAKVVAELEGWQLKQKGSNAVQRHRGNNK